MKQNSIRTFYRVSKKGINNTLANISSVTQRHNNLRVISTPEFPVPYYQRIFRAQPSTEQVSIDMRKFQHTIDQNIVINVKADLAKTSEGLKVLEYVENKVDLKTYESSINSIHYQAEVYAEDLVNYLDAAHEENCRIINEVDLSDCLKI